MIKLKQRIEALEANLKSNLGWLFIVVDNALTDAQQNQINEAKANRRTVVQLSSVDLRL